MTKSPLKVVALTRVFEDGGVVLQDPAPGMSVEAAIRILANTGRPHLATCEVRGPDVRGSQSVYTLHRQVGTKGMLPAMSAPNTRRRVVAMSCGRRNIASYAVSLKHVNSDAQTTELAVRLTESAADSTRLALPSSDLPWTF